MPVLPLLFQFGYLLFLFLVWLLWLGFPVLCWIEVVRVGILVLFLNLAGRLLVFHQWVLCWLWDCCKWLLLCWDMSLYTQFGESLYHEWMLNAVKCLFCMYWDDHVVFVFPFINVVYHIDWFMYVESSLWSWDESNWILVYGPFYVLLDSVC